MFTSVIWLHVNILLTYITTNAMMYTVDREANWSTSTLKGWDVEIASRLSPRTKVLALILKMCRVLAWPAKPRRRRLYMSHLVPSTFPFTTKQPSYNV